MLKNHRFNDFEGPLGRSHCNRNWYQRFHDGIKSVSGMITSGFRKFPSSLVLGWVYWTSLQKKVSMKPSFTKTHMVLYERKKIPDCKLFAIGFSDHHFSGSYGLFFTLSDLNRVSKNQVDCNTALSKKKKKILHLICWTTCTGLCTVLPLTVNPCHTYFV